jgi:hypothetical protein
MSLLIAMSRQGGIKDGGPSDLRTARALIMTKSANEAKRHAVFAQGIIRVTLRRVQMSGASCSRF